MRCPWRTKEVKWPAQVTAGSSCQPSTSWGGVLVLWPQLPSPPSLLKIQRTSESAAWSLNTWELSSSAWDLLALEITKSQARHLNDRKAETCSSHPDVSPDVTLNMWRGSGCYRSLSASVDMDGVIFNNHKVPLELLWVCWCLPTGCPHSSSERPIFFSFSASSWFSLLWFLSQWPLLNLAPLVSYLCIWLNNQGWMTAVLT